MKDGTSVAVIVGLAALGIIVLVLVLKIVAAIATALFVPLLFIAVGAAIGAFWVPSRTGKPR